MDIHNMPAEVEMVDHITLKLIRHMASDDAVVQAAQVSAVGENNADTDTPRLIRALMKDRHGVPFEHTSFTFFGEVPIYVMRELVKHRISSLSEISGRYAILPNRFYTYPEGRPMVNSGTSMRPELVEGTKAQQTLVETTEWELCQHAWTLYKRRIQAGIAREVARSVLPVSTMTQFYWTVNARSLMNALSLRVHSKDAAVISHPQLEIQNLVREMEEHFRVLMPATHQAFVDSKRVAP